MDPTAADAERPPPALVRPARPEDVPAIAALYGEAVRHGTASFETEPPSEAEMLARLERLLDAGYPYLAAQGADGALLGYAYAGPYRTRPAYRWSVETSVYVDTRAQGMGVGRLLLAALIAACEQCGHRQMVAVIGDSANAASIGLHAALGFHMVGTLRRIGFKHGRWLDTVLMQRALAAGDGAPPG